MIDFSTLQGITIPDGEVVSIARKSDGVVLWQKVTSRLPSEYQEVEWVGTSGTQFIDYSEPITTINETKITLSFDQFISSYQTGCYMNSSVQTAVPFLTSRLSGSGHYLNFYSGSQGTVSSPALSLNTPYLITYKTDFSIPQNLFTISQNNDLIWSGTSVPQPDPDQLIGFGIGHNPYIYTTQVGLHGKIYAAQHLRDNVVVRDFVPCYRKSDNVIGMYDLISKTFYTNAGTGVFTSGPDVGGHTVNLLPSALTPNDISSVFDGKGYKNGYYASAAEPFYNTDAAFFCTGLMPIPASKKFYIKGCTIDTALSHTRFGLMKEDGGLINTAVLSNWNGTFTIAELGTQYYSITIDTNNSTLGSMVPYYFYFSASGTGENVFVSATPITT